MQKGFWLALSMASTATFVAVPIGVLWNGAMSFGLRVDYGFPIGMCYDGSESITGDFLFFLVWLVPLNMFPVSLWSGIRAFRTNKLIFFGVGIGLSVMGGAISGLVGGTFVATQVFLPLEMQRVCECKENSNHYDFVRSVACDFVRKRKNT
jgi:hypothetical protein